MLDAGCMDLLTAGRASYGDDGLRLILFCRIVPVPDRDGRVMVFEEILKMVTNPLPVADPCVTAPIFSPQAAGQKCDSALNWGRNPELNTASKKQALAGKRVQAHLRTRGRGCMTSL